MRQLSVRYDQPEQGTIFIIIDSAACLFTRSIDFNANTQCAPCPQTGCAHNTQLTVGVDSQLEYHVVFIRFIRRPFNARIHI